MDSEKPVSNTQNQYSFTRTGGFMYVAVLDLNMVYYTIKMDPDLSKICTIILPWGSTPTYDYQ